MEDGLNTDIFLVSLSLEYVESDCIIIKLI